MSSLPKQSGTAVLVCASRDDACAGWERAKRLTKDLTTSGVSARLVHKLGSDLEELHLIARYKIVRTPCVLILEDDDIIVRLLDVPSTSAIQEFLERHRRLKTTGSTRLEVSTTCVAPAIPAAPEIAKPAGAPHMKSWLITKPSLRRRNATSMP